MKMIDFFCGRGGVTRGFLAAGFQVLGVDIEKHPDYPPQADFLRADILTLPPDGFRGFDVFWFSPPCTQFTHTSLPWYKKDHLPPSMDLAEAARDLIFYSQPRFWVLENVKGSTKYMETVFGPYQLQRAGRYLWSNALILSPTFPYRFKDSFPSNRKDLRSEVPYELALAVARSILPVSPHKPPES